MKKRIFALLLTLVMVISVMPLNVFAQEAHAHETDTETIKYVSLGDSMTNGLGLVGYDRVEPVFNPDSEEYIYSVNGYLQIAPDAYPAQFAEYLETTTKAEVEHTQLAYSGLRAEDVYALLTYEGNKDDCVWFEQGDVHGEPWYESASFRVHVENKSGHHVDLWYGNENMIGKSAVKYDAYFAEGVLRRATNFSDKAGLGFVLGQDGYQNGLAWVSDTYKKAVDEADVITLHLGGNNFATYLTQVLQNYLRDYGLEMGGFDHGTDSETLRASLESRLEELSPAYAAQVIATDAAKKAQLLGLKEVEVRIKGPGAGRESAVRGIVAAGIEVTSIKDTTPVPHNGCRPPKRRRV